jgi:hypothetical protein
MRTQRRRLSLCLLFAGVVGAAGTRLQAADDEINWLGDYQEARRVASQTKKPILVEFRCEA